jgi:hypothetical protein
MRTSLIAMFAIGTIFLFGTPPTLAEHYHAGGGGVHAAPRAMPHYGGGIRGGGDFRRSGGFGTGLGLGLGLGALGGYLYEQQPCLQWQSLGYNIYGQPNGQWVQVC